MLFVVWHETLDCQHFVEIFGERVTFVQAANSKSSHSCPHPNQHLKERDLSDSAVKNQARGLKAVSCLLSIHDSGLLEKYSFVGFAEYDLRFNQNTVEQVSTFLKRGRRLGYLSLSSTQTFGDLRNQEINVGSYQVMDYISLFLHHPKPSGWLPPKGMQATTQQSWCSSSHLASEIIESVSLVNRSKIFSSGLQTWNMPSTLFDRLISYKLAALGTSEGVVDHLHLSERRWKERVNMRFFYKLVRKALSLPAKHRKQA